MRDGADLDRRMGGQVGGGPGRRSRRGNHNQDILFEKITCFFKKGHGIKKGEDIIFSPTGEIFFVATPVVSCRAALSYILCKLSSVGESLCCTFCVKPLPSRGCKAVLVRSHLLPQVN